MLQGNRSKQRKRPLKTPLDLLGESMGIIRITIPSQFKLNRRVIFMKTSWIVLRKKDGEHKGFFGRGPGGDGGIGSGGIDDAPSGPQYNKSLHGLYSLRPDLDDGWLRRLCDK